MQQYKQGTKSTLILFAMLAVFMIVAPLFTNDYSMMVLNIAAINSIATLGISVMLGMGGQLSFAAVSFMGVGAYVIANLTSGRNGFILTTLISLLIAVLVSTLLAYLFGLILFRLKGTYFTFATIGLVQVTWAIYMNYKPISGGPDGISGIPFIGAFGMKPTNYRQWFYIIMVFVLVAMILVERIRRTQLGRSLASIRDNEIAAQTLGVDVYKTKVIAFTIAGALAGLSGGLLAMHNRFVAADLFTFDVATTYIIMAMLGGVNNTAGVFVGSLLVTMLPEWLRPVQQYLKLMFGIGVILLMVFMPMGLAGLLTIILKEKKKSKTTTGVAEDESNS